MSGAPFRDLFVELPAAVFESLQAIGEAAVVKAQRPAPTKAPPRPTLFADHHIRLVLSRYGWRRAETRRIEHEATTYVLAELDCGHGQMYPVDERSILLAGSPAGEIELLDRVVERTPRRCYCVRRPTA